MNATASANPVVQLKIERRSNHPWIFQKMVEKPAERPRPGSVVDIYDRDGSFAGRGFYNGHSHIALRVLTQDPDEAVDAAFFERKIAQAVALRREVLARDREMDNDFTKDAQVAMLRSARAYRGDRLIRTATPHRILDPANGPLIAVKLHVLTRKSLGGIETDLSARALGADGAPVPGLYAAGEAAGFGGGGVHGYRALEGTFLGGCLFSGRAAGRAAAAV